MKRKILGTTIALFISVFASFLGGCGDSGSTLPSTGTEQAVSPASSPTAEPGPPPAPSATVEPALSPLPSKAIGPGNGTATASANKNGFLVSRSEKAQRNYILFLPAEYGNDPQKKWPLIFFLHSYGVRSNNVENLKYEALPQILSFTPDFPFIVVMPQLTKDSEEDYWTTEKVVPSLFTLLEEVQEEYSVDSQKVYLTGVSLGGNGVWEIGLMYPDRFAALVPVMGFFGDTASVEVPDNICDLKDVPVWAFHGAKDHIVPLFAEEDLVDALKACGGNAQLTVYPEGDHDISGQVYNTPELYTWLLSHSLK